MNIEEVAFKDRKNLAQLNENDLLDIIEFLQLDRKQWINQFTQTHNESVEIQKENKKQKDLIDTILNFSFFEGECPLNFGFEDNSKEDKAQNIFYRDNYCENNCNNIYKDCWLKYFKELQGSGSDE